MPPSNVSGILILIAAVIPGTMFTWGFERQTGPYGASLADRILRFIAVSVIFHLLLGWPEYVLYRLAFNGHVFGVGQFAAVWTAVLLLTLLPAGVGGILGELYATRNTGQSLATIRRLLGGPRVSKLMRWTMAHERAPRAWDNLFNERPTLYLRIRTTDGSWLAGLFAYDSYVAAYPNEGDLYLEEAWSLKENLALSERLGYSLYVPARQIAWMEAIRAPAKT
jgi:hypothetical protein